ncbi:protein CFAP276 isoform X1 [Hydra vulgaris]|uniref:protein CFAP276 isoform X1 n=1 Tax=Hydra vulgaris TaxID=6087 RepID=UPI0002B44C2E|nr:protein CFAP276 isoform X1 [Hydra vulgaris]
MPRDPFPHPRFENDNDFTSAKHVSFGTFAVSKSKQNVPWNHLYETKTLASERRTVYHDDPQAPRDSLDFVIKSVYNHHKDFLRSNAETLYQPETLNLQNFRLVNNKDTQNQGQNKDSLPVISVSDKRESIHCINGAISSHHCAATNRGYSRKKDGGFYGC